MGIHVPQQVNLENCCIKLLKTDLSINKDGFPTDTIGAGKILFLTSIIDASSNLPNYQIIRSLCQLFQQNTDYLNIN